jgi:hypothetical protein
MRKPMANSYPFFDSDPSEGSLVDVQEVEERKIISISLSTSAQVTSLPAALISKNKANAHGRTNHEIICTKSKKYDDCEGNKLFREQIELFADDYENANRTRKTQIRHQILATLRDEKKCQFVSENKTDVMTDKKICDKITHALRYHKSKTPNEEERQGGQRCKKRRKQVVETLKKTLSYIPRCRNHRKNKKGSSIFRRTKVGRVDNQLLESTKSSQEFTIETCDTHEYIPCHLISPPESVFTRSDNSIDYDDDNLPCMGNVECSILAYFMESSEDSGVGGSNNVTNTNAGGTVADEYSLPFDITFEMTESKIPPNVSVNEMYQPSTGKSNENTGDENLLEK